MKQSTWFAFISQVIVIGDQIGDILGGFIGGGGGGHGGGGGGGINIGDVAGIIGNLSGGGSKGDKIGGLISGIGGLISKNKGQYHGGGPNVNPNSLNGGMVDVVSGLVGQLAHRFLGVDPTTGKIIGAIAGNVIFNLGGKDNNLGHVGKVVLDNIISGKFKRKVDLWSKITKPLRTKEPDEFSEIGGFPTIIRFIDCLTAKK
uniref:MSP domain-containing protein n=1 Tax=Parascaris univalens TaxID=6257 RepID=A0A915AJW3_PARUN